MNINMKTHEDFKKVITYLTTVGFDDKTEMEQYLKAHGFGVKFQTLYTDCEQNELMFKVEFRGDKVISMEIIKAVPVEIMKLFGSIYIG